MSMNEAKATESLGPFPAQGRNPDSAVVSNHRIQDMALTIDEHSELAANLLRKGGNLPGKFLAYYGFRAQSSLPQFLQAIQLCWL